MGQLLQELMRRPIVFLFVVIWLVGVIGNQIKERQKAKARREAGPKTARAVRSEVKPEPSAKAKKGAVMGDLGDGRRARLAGRRKFTDGSGSDAKPALAELSATRQPAIQDQATRSAAKSTPSPVQAAPARGQSPEAIAREMRRILGLDTGSPVEPVSAPRPAAPPAPQPLSAAEASQMLDDRESLTEHHLELHEASRVGEGIRDRHLKKSQVGQSERPPNTRGAIGNLGGRVQAKKRVDVTAPERRFAMDDLRRVIVMNEILSPPVTMRSPGGRRI